MKPSHIMLLDEIVAIARKTKEENGIEGVTYLGGEPTLQKHLPDLSHQIHREGLGVILFTGYKISQLDESTVSSVDLVVDGPYIENLIDHERNLIGSTNQAIHCITSRYENDMNWFLKRRGYKVEVNVKEDLLFSGDVIN
jgi:anaerobic ribonucleoside-triphosphate reductase activating protein